MMSGLKYNTKNPVQAAILRQGFVDTLRPDGYQKVLEATGAVAVMSATLESIAAMPSAKQLIRTDMLEDHFNLNEHIGLKPVTPYETLAELILADIAFALALALGQVEDADIFSCNNMSIPDWALCAECVGISSTIGKSLMTTWAWQVRTFNGLPQFLELSMMHSVSSPYWTRILEKLGIGDDDTDGGQAQCSGDNPLMATTLETLVSLVQGVVGGSSGIGEYMARIPSLMYADSAKRIPPTIPITLYAKHGRELHVLFNDCLRARGFQTVFIDLAKERDEEDEDYFVSSKNDIVETFSHKRLNRRDLCIQVLINNDSIVIVPVGENFNLKVSLKNAWRPQSSFLSLADSQSDEEEQRPAKRPTPPAKSKKVDVAAAPVDSGKKSGATGRHPASAASAPNPSSSRPSGGSLLSILKKSSVARRYSDEEEGGSGEHDSQVSGDECNENKVVSLAHEERELRELMGLKNGVNLDEYHNDEDDLVDDSLTGKQLREFDAITDPVKRKLWLEKQKNIKDAKLAKSSGLNPSYLEVVRPPINSKDKQTKIAFSAREVRAESTTGRDKMDVDKKKSKDTSPSPTPAKQAPSLMNRIVSRQKKEAARAEEDDDELGDRDRSSSSTRKPSGFSLSSLVKKKREREIYHDPYNNYGMSPDDDGDDCGSEADSRSGDEDMRPSASKRRRLHGGDDIDDDDEDVYMSDGDDEVGHEGGHREEEVPPTYYFRLSNNCIAKPSELFHAFHTALNVVGSKYGEGAGVDDKLKEEWEEAVTPEAMHTFIVESLGTKDFTKSALFKLVVAVLQQMPSDDKLESENWVDLFEEKLYFPPKYSKDHLNALFHCVSDARKLITETDNNLLDTTANIWKREKTQKDFFDLIMKSEDLGVLLLLLATA